LQRDPIDGVEKREVGVGIRPFLRHHGDLEDFQEGVLVARAVVLVLALWMFALELFLRQLNRTTRIFSNKMSC